MTARHLINISGGAASAVAAFRVVERYGTGGVVARFADVGSEDADVYRFLDDVERAIGIEIVRLHQGVDTWQLFEQRGMWFALRGGCVASYHLKRLPLKAHAESVGNPSTTTIYVGFDITEQDRIERLRKAGAPWQFDFPLTWPTPMLHCDLIDFLRRRGIRPPSSYERGFSHANCGGACVLAGIGQWQLLLRDNPTLYEKAERHEQLMLNLMRQAGRQETTILREQVNGEQRSLTLERLREETLSGKRRDLREGMRSCSCASSWLFEESAL
jgi:hypothetical protein